MQLFFLLSSELDITNWQIFHFKKMRHFGAKF